MKSAAAFTQRRSEDEGSEGLHFTATYGAPLMFLTRKEQHRLILRELRLSAKTTDILRALGCYMPNSRVHELRAFGYSITTEIVWVVGADGRRRKNALYTLHEPPDDWTPQGGK